MVIDTSALIAILTQEPEADRMARAIDGDPVRLVSAASVLEAAIVLAGRYGDAAANELDALLREARIEVVPVTEDHVRLARMGYSRFGRGRHPAGLNFGDCFSYALSKAAGQPLLFQGADFDRTDLPRAPVPDA